MTFECFFFFLKELFVNVLTFLGKKEKDKCYTNQNFFFLQKLVI